MTPDNFIIKYMISNVTSLFKKLILAIKILRNL